MRTSITTQFYAVCALVGLGLANPAAAQSNPPKPGNYRCFTTTMGLATAQPNPRDESARAARGLDPLKPGERAIPQMPITPVLIVPAFWGDIVMKAGGTYNFSGQKGSGGYTFNKATSQLTFTGDLSIMRVTGYNDQNYGFFLTYNGTAYQCGLRGGNGASSPAVSPSTPPKPVARVASIGPALKSATAADLTGHFEGSYICGQGETSLTLDLLGKENGVLVALLSFGGANNIPKGSYSLVGKWAGAHFTLKANEWVSQPKGYIMVDVEGDLGAKGVFGNMLTSGCSNFSALRVQQ
jgi:hypothetical protein